VRRCLSNRLRLMPVERDALSLDPKYFTSIRAQRTVRYEFLDRRPPLEMGVDAYERFRPKPATS